VEIPEEFLHYFVFWFVNGGAAGEMREKREIYLKTLENLLDTALRLLYNRSVRALGAYYALRRLNLRPSC
jgi:TRAP-type C4-dicarboxylate transport system permease small subunit